MINFEKFVLKIMYFELVNDALSKRIPRVLIIGMTSLTSPIVIYVPTRASLAVETKGPLFL